MNKGVFHLEGTIKHYDWGGYTFIPSLLQQDNREKKPFAEYWLGIHPLGISMVNTNGTLKKLSALEPSLPFLLKVLDVRDMLSIQVHPSAEAARTGFENENETGIPVDSPLRVYKDPNQKPELMVALSDFWLLHGFKPEKELEYTLLNVVELRELLPVYNEGGYAGLYRHVMEMPQEEVNRVLQPMLDNLADVYQDNEPEKDDEDYWTVRASKIFCHDGLIDRGIFSIYLLNLVHLKKGEGIYQPPGVPHAYLEGQNVEIMANSDNVLRGGLTSKPIAVEELLKHVLFEPTFPKVITGDPGADGDWVYNTDATDFVLSVFEMKAGEKHVFTPGTAEILLLADGSSLVSAGDKTIEISGGNPSAILLGGETVILETSGSASIFRARS
ncbi:MAG TPA: mannose-6-phosphate isomerase, class I [Prolixibacteraceae bacterium]|nr:mannose-6-phosphate isomerase, class I [Prolixibacteraceae bacterium]